MDRGPRGLRAVLLYAAAVAVFLIFCGPLIWMLSQSFKSMPEIVTRPYDAMPRHVTLDNFSQALHGGQYNNVRLARNFINTLIYAGGSLLSNVLLGLMAGYAF